MMRLVQLLTVSAFAIFASASATAADAGPDQRPHDLFKLANHAISDYEWEHAEGGAVLFRKALKQAAADSEAKKTDWYAHASLGARHYAAVYPLLEQAKRRNSLEVSRGLKKKIKSFTSYSKALRKAELLQRREQHGEAIKQLKRVKWNNLHRLDERTDYVNHLMAQAMFIKAQAYSATGQKELAASIAGYFYDIEDNPMPERYEPAVEPLTDHRLHIEGKILCAELFSDIKKYKAAWSCLKWAMEIIDGGDEFGELSEEEMAAEEEKVPVANGWEREGKGDRTANKRDPMLNEIEAIGTKKLEAFVVKMQDRIATSAKLKKLRGSRAFRKFTERAGSRAAQELVEERCNDILKARLRPIFEEYMIKMEKRSPNDNEFDELFAWYTVTLVETSESYDCDTSVQPDANLDYADLELRIGLDQKKISPKNWVRTLAQLMAQDWKPDLTADQAASLAFIRAKKNGMKMKKKTPVVKRHKYYASTYYFVDWGCGHIRVEVLTGTVQDDGNWNYYRCRPYKDSDPDHEYNLDMEGFNDYLERPSPLPPPKD